MMEEKAIDKVTEAQKWFHTYPIKIQQQQH